MPYLKNSLVNLTIILFSLFFLTILSAEESDFIFPKKKFITIKVSENKQDNTEISKSLKLDSLPKKKPFIKNNDNNIIIKFTRLFFRLSIKFIR